MFGASFITIISIFNAFKRVTPEVFSTEAQGPKVAQKPPLDMCAAAE